MRLTRFEKVSSSPKHPQSLSKPIRKGELESLQSRCKKLGKLLDQRSNEMPEHSPPQRTAMRAVPCQELLCLLGVLVYLEVPFTKYHLKVRAKCKMPLCSERVKKGAN